ncbi:MAG TPA: TA system VapC family ribonuclease toxin, partial [Thermoanaerobaculia bacterium]|nr:TA system VapC family ribonuclease toxin [Thermoanaerobaculia bacterium]
MSYSIDVNILLYASDRSSELHSAAIGFLAARQEDPDILYLPWVVAMAYLRIATHSSIFASPLRPEDAIANLENLLNQPRTRPLSETDGFLRDYKAMTGELVVRGNLVPDAHLATILRQHGVRTLYTHDADFARFEFLDVRFPLRPDQ